MTSLPSISLLVGARRYCGARPLSTANGAGCINTLICPTSIEPSRVPLRCSWAEVCRWIASLAGGSSCWGPNEVVARGPRRTPPPSPQTACKMGRKQRPRFDHTFYPSVRRLRMMRCHECIRGSCRIGRYRLRHPRQLSLVPRA